ncbi:EAL domain-containing protein [Terrihabitans rhizophilus]|uniref:EAL domain-containing protein n=1 Tax=Terrihabitans rhizophilus TaxID=3092662 RepID=A0ABU4RRB4_9HYPH|nr:EAL domain-containing protein [Terrihabitans sp. PJ23]MDX6807146.1 EAL domain-containing protein [Terrihabitans sp. PJ23]
MTSTCAACQDGTPLAFDFSMAFQPILDVQMGFVWGYEALVRGTSGESAYSVLSQVTEDALYKFDQACRVKAIGLAGQLFPTNEDTRLSINFMPNAVYEPAACIRASLAAAREAGFPHRRIMFEFTENEKLDVQHVKRIISEYKRLGFITALDDFGAGYAGLGLLAEFQPDMIKIDMHLIRDVDQSAAKQAILAGLASIARQLDITLIAEGVETREELACIRACGIKLVQGYLFAKPAFESLPTVASWAVLDAIG